MRADQEVNPKEILASAKSILLVDWPNAGIPRVLAEKGYDVFCYSPNGYTRAEIVDEYSDADQKKMIPPISGEKGYLVFFPLDGLPASADIVNIYRPEAEHDEIITKHALPLHSRVVWLQPPIVSEKTRAAALGHGLAFIEDSDIAETARQ